MGKRSNSLPGIFSSSLGFVKIQDFTKFVEIIIFTIDRSCTWNFIIFTPLWLSNPIWRTQVGYAARQTILPGIPVAQNLLPKNKKNKNSPKWSCKPCLRKYTQVVVFSCPSPQYFPFHLELLCVNWYLYEDTQVTSTRSHLIAYPLQLELLSSYDSDGITRDSPRIEEESLRSSNEIHPHRYHFLCSCTSLFYFFIFSGWAEIGDEQICDITRTEMSLII